jgi:probable H4MPT-linked C1 transfer pathway protein
MSTSRTHAILGLDVGGANLKAAHCSFPQCTPARRASEGSLTPARRASEGSLTPARRASEGSSPGQVPRLRVGLVSTHLAESIIARSRRFALWQQPTELPRALSELVRSLPTAERVALTMTGELCDCFASKRQGVLFILDAVATLGMPVQVFGIDGRFQELDVARAQPLRAAAANWLALAFLAGPLAPSGPAVLVDIGSTTTDIVPLVDGQPMPQGRTDPERLRYRELVYTGVRRTPLCALLGAESAAELFATTLDAYLVLGRIAEDESERHTADGRPATRACAHARLARMLCADLESSTEDERYQLATQVLDHQVARIETALRAVVGRLPGPPRTVIVAGEGAFLAEEVLARQRAFPPGRVVSLEREWGVEISRAACAYAVALLAAEM